VDLSAWLQELRRRRVIRALFAWGLLSFAILQVVEPLQHALGLGEWFLKAVVAVLAVGFPVTAGLAWAFDLTRKGIERTAPPEGTEAAAAARRAGVRPAVALVAVGALVGAAVAGLAGWHLWGRSPAPGPDGRITVAVADFANETGEREMDGLSGLLITSLEQSRKLAVLTRSRVLDLAAQAGHHSETRVDERIAREVGRKAGARALILASIHRFGTAYAVDLRAVAPEKDAYLFAISERASRKEEIPGLIDRLGDRVRRELREDETAIRQDRVEVGRAVTSSLEAYEHYLRGVQFWDDCDDGEAVRAFQQALAIDPNMALAHLFLAEMAANGTVGGLDAGSHLEGAARSAGALPDKERRLVQAFVAQHSGLLAEAVEGYRKLAADFPQDKMVAYLASRAVSEVSMAEADALLERAVELDPSFVWAIFRLILDRGAEGKMQRTVPLAERAVDVRPRAGTWQMLSYARGISGDLAGSLEAARQSKATSSRTNATGSMTMALALAAAGRLDEAVSEVEPWTAPRVPDPERVQLLFMRAAIETRGGRRRAAIRSVDTALAIVRKGYPFRDLFVLTTLVGASRAEGRATLSAWPDPGPWTAAFYEEFGLTERAAALARNLPAGTEWEKLYRMQLARREGKRDAAARLAPEASANPILAYFAYFRGLTLAEAGRCNEAVTELDRVARLHPVLDFSVCAPLALLEAAKCLEKLDRPVEARERLDRLLALWKGADPDLPLLVEAKAMRRGLEKQAATPRGKP